MRTELQILARVGFDRNWQIVGYPSLKVFFKRFNQLTMAFSTPPLEFSLKRPDFFQHQMATHSVLVHPRVTNERFYQSLYNAMEGTLLSGKSLQELHFLESLETSDSSYYTGAPLHDNHRANGVQNKLWIGNLSVCSFTGVSLIL